MEYPKYEGHYLGIVVQNNDPERRGRVKVFVPHVTPVVYSKWIDSGKDLNFKFIGKNIQSDLSNILNDLRAVLPWANLAMPIVGESASGLYNEHNESATTSDSSNFDDLFGNVQSAQEISANQDGIGEKSGAIFDQNAYALSDAFNNPSETNVNHVNKLSYNYKPETYSNRAKGSFAIPRVGAHVWVFFQNGDPLAPIVFAAAYGETDWGGIYDVSADDLGQDYPGEFENFSEQTVNPGTNTSSYTINEQTYRNKYVINQRGGTLAFVNTDNREMLKMTHFSGSFKEFNNQANIELAINNDQKLVVGDSFLTIRGTRNEFSQQDYDCVVQGDRYKKVGDLGRVLLHEKWKSLMNNIADVKQRFDIMRCNPAPTPASSLIKLNSKGQAKAGKSRLCPVCTSRDDLGKDLAINNFFPPNTTTFGFRVATQDSNTKTGDGAFASRIIGGNHIEYSNGNVVAAGGDGTWLYKNGTTDIEIVAADGSIITSAPGFLHSSLTNIDKAICPICNSGVYGFAIPGQSPSSYGGFWLPDPEKATLTAKYNTVLKDLAPIEAVLGKGGSEIIEIEKNKIENVGLVMNDWGAIRVDIYGKMDPAFLQVFPGYTRAVAAPSPLIEVVQVDDLPGGTYNLNVANKYNILVGAGGVNLKSYGVVNISGALTNIAGEQVNIGSGLETNIDGGRRLSMVGDIVRIAQRGGGQVLVDSDLGVTGKTVIKGSLYVEGPIWFQELHGVAKVQKSNKVQTGVGGLNSSSPFIPMGVGVASDTAHLIKVDTAHNGIDFGNDIARTPIYLGYTDTKRVVTCAPSSNIPTEGKLLIGAIPPATGLPITLNLAGLFDALKNGDATHATLLATTDYIPVVAVPNGTLAETLAHGAGYDIKQTGIPDDFGKPSLEVPLPVNIKSLCQISNSPLNRRKYRPEADGFITTMSDAIGLTSRGGTIPGPKYDSSDGTYIPGAGYGTDLDQNNLPLRGLPAIQRIKYQAYTSLQKAMYSPIAVHGDGGDFDAMQTAEMSVTFQAPAAKLVSTNMANREQYINNQNGPVIAQANDYNYDVNKLGDII